MIHKPRLYRFRGGTTAIVWLLAAAGFVASEVATVDAAELTRLRYNHPGLVVDLGVGLWAWPLPMDFDGDGDLDLVVACPDVPSRGIHVFENTEGNVKLPTFRPGRLIGPAQSNVCVSYVDGEPVVTTPGHQYPLFKSRGIDGGVELPVERPLHDVDARTRANQWKYVDFDGDSLVDLVVGIGDWTDYGWDNAFNSEGKWTNGPLHGFVYWLRNTGSNEEPRYTAAVKVEAAGAPIDVYGMPSPCFDDFDGDGDLDLICGEFIDRLTYFENTGTRRAPRYAKGRFLEEGGETIHLELCMIVPTSVDWDRDGDVDLVVGQEDGRVALVENTGRVVDGMPDFEAPRFFKQHAEYLKIGALVTPVSYDWDADGDEDLICGDTAGYLTFVENLDVGTRPKWAAPRRLRARGKTIRIMAGPNGSIQGPCETKWGYTVPAVADWNHDSRPDIVVNSIWGAVQWFENSGSPERPFLAAAQPVIIDWESAAPKPAWNWWEPADDQLVTQWRTSPIVRDMTDDGLNDLVMLDHEGFLTLFERYRRGDALRLKPGRRVFLDAEGQPLQLNPNTAGKSGRRKMVMVDWDLDGRDDILINGRNVDFLRNVGGADTPRFENLGPVAERRLAGHTTCPTVVDWNRDQVPDLLVGAEDGLLYYLENPHSD